MNDSSSNKHQQNHHSAKTGRKGDPRMHRAVAARMENPELSLFEALRIGGFDYPADEDASVMDSEKVTLGQRKNQLSRRLRLARKQQQEEQSQSQSQHGGGGIISGASVGGRNTGDGGATGFDAGTHNGMMNSLGSLGGGSTVNAGGFASSMSAMMKQQQQQQQQLQQQNMSSEAQRQLEKLMQHSQQSKLSGAGGNNGVKRNAAQLAELGPDAELHPSDEANIMDEKKRMAKAKFHPQYQPLFVPRASSSVRNAFGTGNSHHQLQTHQSHQLGSQFGTPNLGPLSAPLTPLGAPPSTSFAAAAFPSLGSLGQSTSGLSASTAGTQRHKTSQPSSVAVASLASTANSVGLSLEQLAVALSSSSNLVKVLSSNSSTEQQQELALRLFRNESRALYQRCMLLAGYRPEDAEEKSQNHLQFAFTCWQEEGRRLQELLGDNGNNSSSTTTASMAQQQQQVQVKQEQDLLRQEQQQQHGHSHNNGGHDNGLDHDHSHGHEHGHSHEHQNDGHHVHQLEGKCGHKAIIHQPEGGSAHIDFVVGDKVECYHGIQPVGNKSISVWPSKYKCEDLSCPQPCADIQCDEREDVQPVDIEPNKSYTPKILDLSDIDLSGAEWNSDLNGPMGGTLLGLFKLGDSDDKDTDTPGTSGQTDGGSSDGFGISV